MYCRNCGEKIDDSSDAFCTNCGKRIEETDVSAPVNQAEQPSVYKPIPTNAEYQPGFVKQQERKKKAKKDKTIAMVVCVCFTVFLLIGLLADKDTPQTSTVHSSTAPASKSVSKAIEIEHCVSYKTDAKFDISISDFINRFSSKYTREYPSHAKNDISFNLDNANVSPANNYKSYNWNSGYSVAFGVSEPTDGGVCGICFMLPMSTTKTAQTAELAMMFSSVAVLLGNNDFANQFVSDFFKKVAENPQCIYEYEDVLISVTTSANSDCFGFIIEDGSEEYYRTIAERIVHWKS